MFPLDSQSINRRSSHPWLIGCFFIFLLVPLCPICAQQQTPDRLAEMSLEELMNIEVTTAGKKDQTLSQVPAAVYVITQEEIRRSGATRLPELFRLAPGVQVAQINASTWAISIRGFNYRYSNKLLVMIDGRIVYSPTFSGVYWDMQNLVLEDIERIEIVRGPGGTLWGANAVNGVINVITKRPQDTQGGLLGAGGGSQGRAISQARFGGHNQRENYSYRLYVKYFREGRSPSWDGPRSAYDAWSDLTGGFRFDWQPASSDLLAFSGQLYRSSEEQTYSAPLLQPPYSRELNVEMKGTDANFMVNWQHHFGGGSLSTVQAWYDHLDRLFLPLGLQQQMFAIDIQHQVRLSDRHELVLGGEFRFQQEKPRSSDFLSFGPANASQNVFSGFIQDDIALHPRQFWLTLGSKFESNPYTGLELQPSVRLRWNPDPAHNLWAAVSRAVRTPSLYEEQGRVDALAFPGVSGLTSLIIVLGNQNLRSEQLLAYELGYRSQPAAPLSFDITAFYSVYQDIIGFQTAPPFLALVPPPPHLVVPNVFANNLKARSKGLELSTAYRPRSWWKIGAGYSWLQIRQTTPPGSLSLMLPGDNPRHLFNLRSYWSLPWGLEFDTAAFHTSTLTGQGVPGVTRLDARLGWRANEHLDFSLSSQNLLDPRHAEFVQLYDLQGPAQVGRVLQGGITLRF